MNIPTPPWYKTLNEKLEGSKWLVDLILVGVILISVYMLLSKNHVARITWAVYLISP